MAIDHEAILRRAAEVTSRSEELLAEPRPEVTYQPPQPTRYRGYEVETMHDMLKASEARMDNRLEAILEAIEARFSVRLDALESNIASLRNGLYGLADESGTATGEVEKKLRDEMRKEVESLRGDVALLRAEMKASQPQRHKQTVSRAPFKLMDEDNAFPN